jgi:hypothetical protein
MKQDTFQKALTAAAKITCCASLFGLACNKKVDVISTPDSPEDTEQTTDTSSSEDTSSTLDTASNNDTSDTTDSGTQDTDSGSQDTDSGNQETGDTENPTDPSYDEECQALITSAFPDPNVWPDPATIPQEVKDCCQLAAEYYDELSVLPDGTWDWTVISEWEHRDQCCASLEWQSNTLACTPWGPPMPPKFTSNAIHRPKKLRRILVSHA